MWQSISYLIPFLPSRVLGHRIGSPRTSLFVFFWGLSLAATSLSFGQEANPSAPVAVSNAGSVPDLQQRVQLLEQYIENSRKQWNVPGLSMAIVHKDQLVLCKGFGVKEAGKNETVDANTLFAIASNSKAFTAAALAILVDDKKIRWDDRVQTYLPWFQLYDPHVSSDMRISDLLCHRSGLGTFSGDLLWYGTPFSPKEIVERCRHLPPAGPFRAHYGYSNVMFVAAGLVIEKVSGKSWSEFVTERILRPIEMNRSITSVRDLVAKGNYATPHKTVRNGSEPIAWVNWDTMVAAGGIISSAQDMSMWMRLQLRRGKVGSSMIFSEEASNEMWQSHTPIRVSPAASKRIPSTHFRSYGLGWGLADYAGRKIVSHGGGYDGMYSHQILIPEEELGIVVLTNSMTSLPDSLVWKGVDVMLGLPERDWSTENFTRFQEARNEFQKRIDDAIQPRATGTQPSHPLSSYVGEFECPLMGRASVKLEGEKLVLRIEANPDLVADLQHLHYDTFVLRWRNRFAWFDEGTVLFLPNAKGDFVEIKLDVPNDDLWFHELAFRKR